MGRAERRRLEREKSKQKTATYNLTKEQLDKLVEDQIKDRLKVVKKQANPIEVREYIERELKDRLAMVL